MKPNITKKQPKLTFNNERYSERKYRIVEVLDNLPFSHARNLKAILPSILAISRQQFSKWCNAPIDSSLDIPSSKLLVLAANLSVQPADLFNVDLNITPQVTDTGLVK